MSSTTISGTSKIGRRGIEYEQVAAAADALVAEGLRPTLDAVHGRVGSGSRTTVQQHMSKWKGRQPKRDPLAVELPPAIHREFAREMDRRVAEATIAVRQELADTVRARDAIVEESAQRAEMLEKLEQRCTEQSEVIAAQVARIDELRASEQRERASTEACRQNLGEAVLQLNTIPLLTEQIERMRAELDARAAELRSESTRAAGYNAERAVLAQQLVDTQEIVQRLTAECRMQSERATAAELRAAIAEARAVTREGQLADQRALPSQPRRGAGASAKRWGKTVQAAARPDASVPADQTDAGEPTNVSEDQPRAAANGS